MKLTGKRQKEKEKGDSSLLPFPFYLLLSVVSGVFMGLTVAPVGAWFLAWIAIAPLWVLVVSKKVEIKSRKFYLLPLLWAIAYHGVALSWITGIYPMDWLNVPWLPALAITLFCWAFISLWGGLLVMLWAIGMVYLNQPKAWLRVLIGTALWCSLESLWSAGFLVEFSGLYPITPQLSRSTFGSTFWNHYDYSVNSSG